MEPVVPATQEAEARKLLNPRIWSPAWAKQQAPDWKKKILEMKNNNNFLDSSRKS